MENASKALIIAGSILIAIVLISLGILIINQARDNIDGGLAGPEVQVFNSKFSQYEGKQSGTTVRAMIQEVVSSNGDQKNKDLGIFVSVTGSAGVTISKDSSGYSTVNGASGINARKQYTVTLTKYENPGGRVSVITIST